MKCGKAPCKSCPYRKDVPPGLWHPDEYDKLPLYDGSITDQVMNGGTSLFMCHQQDGNLCAGWIATHNAELFALRVRSVDVDDMVWGYQSPIQVFSSGMEAAEHGKSAIDNPPPAALSAIKILQKRADRRARN